MADTAHSTHLGSIAPKHIQLPVPLSKHRAMSSPQENRRLKKQNELLRRQLQSISTKLDLQIRKKIDQNGRKPWSKPEDVTGRQLQNAYKQLDIYKKQASFYRKKMDLFADQSVSKEYQCRVMELDKNNRKLIEEIVSLKRIIKIQEKGLEQLGIEGYLTLTEEKQRQQQQIRKLNKQLCEYRRKQNAESNHQPTQQLSNLTTQINCRSEARPQRLQSHPVEQLTPSSMVTVRQNKQLFKLKTVNSQKQRLQEQLSRYKEEMTEKNKEIRLLKDRVDNLRRNNQLLQSQSNYRYAVGESAQVSKPRHNRSKVTSKHVLWTKATPQTKIVSKLYAEEQDISKDVNIIKWSHEAFGSKIKQLQILVHPNGHIKDIHARYEKGEPKHYHSHERQKYQSLVCREGEHVTRMSGCMLAGYLQCLTVSTSDQRSQTFGDKQSAERGQGQKIELCSGGDEIPGGLFGETDQKGVRRIGCMEIRQ